MLESRRTAGPIKLAVARACSSQAVGRVVGALAGHSIRSHGIRIDTSGVSPDLEASLFFGIYESAEIRMLRRYLANAETVVELGSSIGITTAHLLDVMSPNGHLVCVEPHPDNVDVLRSRVDGHRKSQRVDIHAAAISAKRGKARLAIVNSVGSQLGSSGVEVETIPLRDIVANLSEFALMCDIEGAETSFIFQDPDCLRRCRRLVIEMDDTTWNGQSISADDTFDELRRQGFICLDQRGPVVAMSAPWLETATA